MISNTGLFHSPYILNEGKCGKVFTTDSVKNQLWLICIGNKAAFLFPVAIFVSSDGIRHTEYLPDCNDRSAACGRHVPEAEVLQEAEQGDTSLPAVRESTGGSGPGHLLPLAFPSLNQPSSTSENSHHITAFPFRESWPALVLERKDENRGKVHGRRKWGYLSTERILRNTDDDKDS